MIDSGMFFNGWYGVVRVLVVGTLGYVGLILMLRLSRKRSLVQMNVFDFVYVVVMGELLAITILDDRVSLVQGLVALAALIGLQVVASWLTTRSTTIEHVINGEPTLLMRRGRFLHDAMHAQRVTESEILSAVRLEGVTDLEQVEAVVLETDGEFSVLHFGRPSNASALRDVAGANGDGNRTDRPAAPREKRATVARTHVEGGVR
jgi:uncharacterized membrane protein YcaP (DUF421 family)